MSVGDTVWSRLPSRRTSHVHVSSLSGHDWARADSEGEPPADFQLAGRDGKKKRRLPGPGDCLLHLLPLNPTTLAFMHLVHWCILYTHIFIKHPWRTGADSSFLEIWKYAFIPCIWTPPVLLFISVTCGFRCPDVVLRSRADFSPSSLKTWFLAKTS